MRTVGLVDITTRADVFNNSGIVGVYGGSQGTITPYFEYGGTFGSNCPTIAAAPERALAVHGLSAVSSISSRAVTCRRRGNREFDGLLIPRSTISPSRKKASPTCRRSSTRRYG